MLLTNSQSFQVEWSRYDEEIELLASGKHSREQWLRGTSIGRK